MLQFLAAAAAALVALVGADTDGCFYPDVNFKEPALILDKAEAEGPKQCQAMCCELATEGKCCHFFSYEHESSTCFMWDDLAFRFKVDTKSVANTTWTAGPKNCDGCLTYGFNVGGYNMRDIGGVTCVDDCQEICQNTPGCAYFAYDPESNGCWLKWPGLVSWPPYIRYISGPRSCTGCFKTGKAFSSHECIEEVENVPSAIACQHLCAVEKECGAFTYYPDVRKCQLNGLHTGGLEQNPDAISGPKGCPTCDCTKDN